ncbi:hypothetical protein VNO77_46907 [Canavalia gladiata]|uniref:Uncharacterized protein n=1 Tax=Canavalia gladiata TaxID=3824 RepID=A0AAN9JI28_CANGL
MPQRNLKSGAPLDEMPDLTQGSRKAQRKTKPIGRSGLARLEESLIERIQLRSKILLAFVKHVNKDPPTEGMDCLVCSLSSLKSVLRPTGDRLRETISIYTWLSSIGRWLIEANPVLEKISNKKTR